VHNSIVIILKIGPSISGAVKLGFSCENTAIYTLVLESDGTEVDEEYFLFVESNTTFILLGLREKWEQFHQGI
jgi:hypothetical protein